MKTTTFAVNTVNTYSFTKFDLCNFYKWTDITNNETLSIALNNLQCTNSINNHITTFNNIIGYLKCMVDFNMFYKNAYIELLDEIKFLKNEMFKHS